MRLHIPAKLVVSTVLVVVVVFAAAFAPTRDVDVTVHEWGTFTTVAGKDGRAIDWLPLSGPTDLPCFVHHYQNNPLIKVGFTVISSPSVSNPSNAPLSYEQARTNLVGKVRMETPVLYFYAPEETTVNVQVQFPRGLMTEWYPQARVTQSAVSRAALRDPNRRSVIEWPRVTITPTAQSALPRDVAESHYYAARATDAALIEANGQREKFLFYRGLADFDVPISTEVLADGGVRIRNLGEEALPSLIVFENRAGRIGYSVLGALQTETVARAPMLNATGAQLRADLVQLLVAQGLYPKEAAAMVDTWRDSWFEEGTRVLYIVPTAAVDRILPLRVSPTPPSVTRVLVGRMDVITPPAPASVTRVFVGRMDVITPAMEEAVGQALTSDSDDVIERFGRLLEPITQRILERTSGQELQSAIAALRTDAFARYTTAAAKCR